MIVPQIATSPISRHCSFVAPGTPYARRLAAIRRAREPESFYDAPIWWRGYRWIALDRSDWPERLANVTHVARTPAWPIILVRAIAVWVPIAAATTGLAGLVYAAMQQNLRLDADDAAAALALRTAQRLDDGVPATAVLPTEPVELSNTLDPFVMVFDPTGQVLASSATLHSHIPAYPTGVFDVVRKRGEDRVTWQPEDGVREATVSRAWPGGYVVAGHSLQLTEQHIAQIGLIVVVGWLATLVLVAVAALATALLTSLNDGLLLAGRHSPKCAQGPRC